MLCVYEVKYDDDDEINKTKYLNGIIIRNNGFVKCF